MKKIFLILLLFVVSLTFISCKKEKLTITGKDTVEVGCSIVLSHNYDGDEEVVWSSSDPAIATIIDGMVIGYETGSVVISLVVGNEIAYKDITVTESLIEITIEGQSQIVLGSKVQFAAILSKEVDDKVSWESLDEEVATVDENGLVTAIKVGETIIKAKVLGKESSFPVKVLANTPTSIIITGENKVEIGKTTQLNITVNPSDANINLKYESNNLSIATVDENGLVKGLSKGKATIKVSCSDDETIYSEFEIEVVEIAPISIVIAGEKQVIQGKHNNLSVEVNGENVSKEVIWETSDPSIAICYQGIVLGVNKGNVTITAKSVVDNNIKGSIDIEVTRYIADGYSSIDVARVDEIISNMTLSQKIGQMFVVGFNGTLFDQNLVSAIEEYNFGNVIYMGYNVSNPNTLGELSNAIQTKMVEENGVAAFISIDQEGGRVARLVNGGTHFISNMAMGATGDYNNTYLEGSAMGKELRNYGINANFAPVLDVNNNPENPIIGIRSYSDNPLLVSLYGNNMFKGLKESNVMGCSKHFPGHGNTSVDSHYGLPTITTPMNELYQTELAPFISAVSNGIDSIMTTHIIFSAIDQEYPATLSSKVLTNLLREELGYDGLIITDGMEMAAVTNNFGGHDETSVLAVKAGVDILLYTSNTNPRIAHSALMDAVENGEISEERINESLRRILLKKLEYGLLDNYLAKDENINSLLAENEALNLKFAMDSLTLVKGDFAGLDKSKSTLIISPETTYALGEDLLYNSFSNYAWSYLRENGYENCDYYVVDNNISNYDSEELLEMVKSFDQIVIAMSNVKTSNYTKTASFVNKLATLDKEVVVIALDTPYDLMSYSNNVKNYICVYGYQKATVIALSKYLNGEFTAKGKFAVSKGNFEGSVKNSCER